MYFKIKLADKVVGVEALFPETKDFCENWLSEEKEDFSVCISAEDIINERIVNARQMALDGLRQEDFSDQYLETLALYRKITKEMLKHDILLFHGCVIAYKGKSYIFTAKSGTGKTTHIRLWLKQFPESYVLNGDKPLIMFRNGEIFACGTPWMGKENYGKNEILPLCGICLLERAENNSITDISLTEAFQQLVTQAHRPQGESTLKVIGLIKQLGNIPLCRLGCNMEPDAATVSFNRLVLGKKSEQ